MLEKRVLVGLRLRLVAVSVCGYASPRIADDRKDIGVDG